MKLYADSGSTKTSWILVKNNSEQESYTLNGLNPFFVSESVVLTELKSLLKEFNFLEVKELFFYGAGCSTLEKANWLKEVFQTIFINAKISIKTDIECAVLASVNKNEKSIVSILGTGSSFRVFDGEKMLKKYSSLGYIIGDEGSGTHVSKALLRKVFYKQLPIHLENSFFEFFETSRDEIIENVYSKPLANRYLAKFTVFCKENIHKKEVEEIVINSFNDYFKNHITTIENYNEYKLHFVGSIAFYFQEQLEKIAKKYSCQIGTIIQKPLERLVEKINDK